MIKSCTVQLQEFLEGPRHNMWLEDDVMQVYVRKGKHLIGNDLIDTLDIANITVFEPGKGKGTTFLQQAHEINPYPVTFIESILNIPFLAYLIEAGWLLANLNTTPYSVFKYTH